MFTIADLKRLEAEGFIRGFTSSESDRKGQKNAPQAKKGKKGSKYGAVKCEVDGIRFDSKKEANRYKELVLMFKAGLLTYLEVQVPYELNQGGTHSLKYIADFVYTDSLTGETIVEDAKGYRTKEYRKKRRLMKKVHSITIKEI